MGKKMTRRQKLRLKKIMGIIICIVIVVIVVTAIIVNILQNRNARVFTDGTQTITLRENGTFTAELYHGVIRSGDYKEMSMMGEDGEFIVVFFQEKNVETTGGFLVDNILTYPEDWDDIHGHNRNLELRER